MLGNIPAEMRAFKQFVLWRYEDRDGPKPTKVPYAAEGYRAAVDKPQSWCTYETAVETLRKDDRYAGIGFVLTRNDPFAFIDLDDPYDQTKGYDDAKSKELLERQIMIHEMFNCYSERSPSGKGLHIICKGNLQNGRKRAQVEVYSSDRFMTMTGDTFNNAPIENRDELINQLWSEMGRNVTVYTEFGDRPQTMDDDAVCSMAASASNGAKFLDLYNGEFISYYSSQSEADFALIDIIAFYTQNREQIRRIFLQSALGQRAKALRVGYIEFMTNRSFDHMLPPVDIEGLKIQIESALLAKQMAEQQAELLRSENAANEHRAQSDNFDSQPSVAPINNTKKRRYPLPPGVLGEIAQFIESAAIRPVPEIALAGAIGLMSGVCGRAYNISRTGLNQYTILIAPTGTGKEAMAGGIDRLMAAVAPLVPNGHMFIGPGEIASPQALAKHFHRHSKSFVAMPGEIGLWLQNICSPLAGPSERGIMRAMLQLYNVSGEGNTYKPTINSDKEKSTDMTIAPAFSLLGESTPEQFYRALDEAMISSGLVPRFNIIEYHGKRPKKNAQAMFAQPSDDLVKRFATVCTNALSLNEINKVINIGYSDEGLKLLDDWDKFCDGEMEAAHISGGGEVKLNLWNRAHMNALKLAGLVAVGCHPYTPIIDYAIAEWAIKIVYDNVVNILGRFDAGEVGSEAGEGRQLGEATRCIHDYIVQPHSAIANYGIPISIHAERIIPFSYLSKRLCSLTAFKSDKRGASAAVARTIQTMIERGDVREVPRGDMNTKFGTTQRAFVIAVPRSFGL